MSIQILLEPDSQNDKYTNYYGNSFNSNVLSSHNIISDDATINNKLLVKATNSQYIDFTPPDIGIAGDVLATDGLGHMYFTSNPAPPLSGILYNGIYPAPTGNILKISNVAGTTANESKMNETVNNLDLNNLNILNADSITSNTNNTTTTNTTNILNPINLNLTTPTVNFNSTLINVNCDTLTTKTTFLNNQEFITKKYVDDAISVIPATNPTLQDVYNNSTLSNYTIDLTLGDFKIVSGINPILTVSNVGIPSVITSTLKTDSINSNVFNKIDITAVNGLTSNKYVLNGGLNSQYLMADGSTLQSSQIGSNIYLYQFDTLLTPIPPIGHIEFNNVSAILTTNVYISHITSDGIDIDPFFFTIQTSDILYIQDRNNSTKWVKFNVVSTSIISNSYINILVSYNSSLNMPFTNNHNIYFSIFTNNTLLDTRVSTLETKTQNQLATFGNTNFTGTVKADTLALTSLTTNILLGDGNTIAQYNIAGVGTGSSLINNGTGSNFTTKSIINGSGIGLSATTTDITLTNSSPASGISLSDSGTGETLLNSTTNPSFTTKSLIAGSNISLVSTATDITINSTGGGGASTTFWDFLPTNISNKGSLLNNTAYFNMAIVPNTITINTIRFILPDSNPSANVVRFALYKGQLSSGNTCILQAQSVSTIPTNAIGLQIMTFTAEIGKSLTFNTGDILWLTFSGTLILATFFGNGSADLDNCFLLPTNYTAGFPAFLTNGLGRVQTNIRVCGLFNT
jgi:hypothetical protein